MRSRERIAFGPLLAAALLAACTVTPSGAPAQSAPPASLAAVVTTPATGLPPLRDVPYFRGDVNRTMAMPGPGLPDRPVIAWRRDFPHQPVAWPILVGGLLIVPTDDNSLTALDGRTSEVRWTQALPGVVQNVSADGSTLVEVDDAGLSTLDATTGRIGWRQRLVTPNSRPTIVDGQVYVGASDGTVHAFDLSTGEETSHWDGPSGVPVRVDVVHDDAMYVATFDGRLIVVDRPSGKERCTFRTLATRVSVPLVAGETVYVSNVVPDDAARTGEVAAVDVQTCEARWKYTPPSGDQAVAGLVSGDVLYVATKQDGLIALRDRGDHFEPLWTQPSLEGLTQPPALVDGLLFSLSVHGTVAAVRAADGSIAWQQDLKMDSSSGPILSGGELFLTADNGGGTAVISFAEAATATLLHVVVQGPTATAAPSTSNPFSIEATYDWATTTVGYPLSMAAGPNGLLYVADVKPQIVVIDPKTGRRVRAFGAKGGADGQFDFGSGENLAGEIAIWNDQLVVSDSANHRFQLFDLDGKHLRNYGRQGTDPGQFVRPGLVRAATDGSLYLEDSPTNTLTKLDKSGDLAWRVGGDAGAPELRGGGRFFVLPDGRPIFFRASGGQGVALNPVDGSVAGTWGPSDLGDDPEMSVDPDGHVYIHTYVPHLMRVFDASGSELGAVRYGDIPSIDRPEQAWADWFWPAPVFPGDGFGYSFGREGLVRVKVSLP